MGTSHTDTNPGRQFFNCGVEVCSFFRWIENESSTSSPSNFQGIAKFELLTKLRESEENRNLLMTFLKEAQEQQNRLKVLLQDVERDIYQLKEMLILAEEEKTLENCIAWFNFGVCFLEICNRNVN